MAGRANSLNTSLEYTAGYDASLITSGNFTQFNFSGGFSADALNAWFVRGDNASTVAIIDRVRLNGSISFPYSIYNNKLLTATASAISSAHAQSNTLTTPIALSSAGVYLSLTSGGSGGTGGILVASATSSPGFANPTITNPTTSGFTAVSLTNQAGGKQLGTFTYKVNGFSVNNYSPAASGGSSGSPTSLALPTTSAVGDYIGLMGVQNQSSFGFVRVTQAANQYIKVGSSQTTVGTSGYIQNSLGSTISMDLICIEANLGWAVVGAPSASLVIV